MDARLNPAASSDHAARVASVFGHVKVAKLLLAGPRVNPSADDNYAVLRACRRGHVEVLKLLLADTRVKPSLEILKHALKKQTKATMLKLSIYLS